MEQRLLLTATHNDPGEFFYSLVDPSHVYNSDHSKVWADDSDIVKLTIEPDGSWQHEIYFDGSDVGLTAGTEDINAFTIRNDGSLLISTTGRVTTPGISNKNGGDLLQFTPTSLGNHTSGNWQMYVDGSDVGISQSENIAAVAELADGSLVISLRKPGNLPDIGAVRGEDLSTLTLTSTGNYTSGTWNRYFDGSDVGLTAWAETIDGVSLADNGSTVHLSPLSSAAVPGVRAYDEDIFTFEASSLGAHTAGSYRNKLTLNGSTAGISSSNDIDAFHMSMGDPANPQPPVIEKISDQSIDEWTQISLTPTASDPDTPATELAWTLASGPASATVDPATGRFEWTPEESDGPGVFDVTLAVTDGLLNDTESFVITVGEVNIAPVLGSIGSQSVGAGGTLSFDVDATDADLPANTLVYSISGEVPDGANFDSSTGQFTWNTTSAHAGNSYAVTVEVSDGNLTDTETFTIAVSGASSGLQVNSIDDQVIDELVPFSYQVMASNSGGSQAQNIDFETALSGVALTAGTVLSGQFSAQGIHVTTHDPEDHPAMIFDSSNPTGHDYDLGTPNSKFGGPGIGNGGKSGRWRNDEARGNILIISEDPVDNIGSDGPDDNARGGKLIFTFDTPTSIEEIGLLDIDSGRNTIDLYNAAGIRFSRINVPRRGNNSYQTIELDAEGVSRLELNLSGSGAITDLVFCGDGNCPPVGPLTYALAPGAPEGMTISDTGLIEWTPSEAQGPDTFDVNVIVSDGAATVTENFEITVGEVNIAPVITAIADQQIDELIPFSYQVDATDSDLPANTLTYSLATGAPAEMTINAAGLIEWTPAEAQGPDAYSVTVQVSDGTATSIESFDVTVGEVNTAPMIASITDQQIDELASFSYQVDATDSDLPANTLKYSLKTGAPVGMTISVTGLIEWTPTEAQGPDEYSVTVEVSDGTATSTESFGITVGEVNTAPVMADVADQTIDEEVGFSLQVEATDADLPGNSLSYNLTGTPPAGISIDENGLLAWTPSEIQGPGTYSITVEVSDGQLDDSKTFEIEVAEVNRAPEIQPILDVGFNELSAFTLQVEATDPDLPANTLDYNLIGSVPAGVEIDNNGLISWTPTEAQGPLEYQITIEVSDGSLTDVDTFRILVGELNEPPELTPIGNQTVVAGQSLTFIATATDADVPANVLLFSVSGDVPADSTFNSSTGEFFWNSSVGETTGNLTITVRVDDQNGGTDSETFTIAVLPVTNPSITLTEDDRFETTAMQSITVPAGDAYFEFDILNLSFDLDATGKASDAFEVALLDSDGNSLVHSISADRDAFFNASERGAEAAGVNTVVDGSNVRIDLSHIPAGTTATVVYRLVNNDNADGGDTATTVTFTEGAVIAGNLNTPAGATVVQSSSAADGPVDLSTLIDVTSSLTFTYQQTSFNDETNTLFADIWVTNNSSQPVDGPFVLVVQNLTDPLVAVSDFDGTTADSDRYYLLDDLSNTGTIQPGESTLARTLTFINPDESPFDYQLTVLASPNAAPAFTSRPVTLVESGRPYSYDSNAEDPNGDSVTYELLAGPTGMTMDSVTGEVTWSPKTADLGNQSVVIRASDGRGAFDEQQFTVEVRDVVPNRPPVIISSPVIQAFVSTDATQEIGNLVVNGDFEDGDTGFTTDMTATGIGSGAGAYSVTSDPRSEFFAATSYGDFTTGDGLMFAVNGSLIPGSVVWEQTVAVVPGRTYDFATAISSWFPDAPAALLFSVNGEDIGALNAPAVTAQWEQLFATWESVDATSATIQIKNANVAFGGNDFALDGIYFGGPRFSNPSYQYDVNAVDADADPITYSLDQAPDGMSIDPTSGLIGWNPGANQLGNQTVRVVADDGRGGKATQEYQVVVLSDEGNSAPVIVTDPVDSFFIPGFSNPMSGDVTPQRISLDLGNGETFDGTVSITLPDGAGRFADIVLAVDESASMSGEQAWIAEMIPLLDNALKAQGVGDTTENPNRFALVGFGGGSGLIRGGITAGHFLNQHQPTRYTLYGPGREVVTTGRYDDFVPDDLLNLQLPDDGRYVLVVEAADATNLVDGIDLGFEGQFGDSVRKESLVLGEIVDDRLSQPGQPVEYDFTVTTPTPFYFDSLERDRRVRWSLRGASGPIVDNVAFDLSDVTLSNPVLDLSPGDYTLTVTSVVSNTLHRNVNADYRFRAIDLAASQQIVSGETITGEFVERNETFAYRFNVTSGQRFEFVNSITASHSGSKWRLIDPNRNVVTLPDGATSKTLDTNQAAFSLPATGEYYLLYESAHANVEGNFQVREPILFDLTVNILDAVPPTALTLGETVNGTLDFIGDFDEYAFSLSSRKNVAFDSLVNNTMRWTLAGPEGTTPSKRLRFTDSLDGNSVMDLVPGNYTLRIDSNGIEGDYALRLLDIATGSTVIPGIQFDGEFSIPQETDLYRFEANAGDQLFVDVVSASAPSSADYKVYDQYGRTVYDSSSLTDSSPFSASIDGTYSLLVEGRSFNVDSSSYSINIVPVVTTTQVLALDTVTSGMLDTPGQSATYTFSLGAGTQLYFDSLTNVGNILWSLEGPSGLTINSLRFDRSDSLDRVDSSIDARPGDYRLTVFAVGDAVGNFSFAMLDLLNPYSTTAITPNPGAANLTVNVTPTAGLDSLQTEVFRFTADPGDELSFVTNVTGSIGSYYRILDQNGSEVVARTNLISDRLNQTLSLGGTYYLLVEPRYNNTDVDDWSIDINFVQNNGPTSFTGTALTVGDTISGTLATAGQVDGYTFTVTERSNYYFDSLTNTSSIRWTLNGPTGNLVSNRRFSFSDSINQTNVAFDLIPGDYQIEIDASSGTPSDYNFRLQNLSTGTPITFGTPFSGDLTPSNETDIFRFDAAAGDTFYFDVESASDVDNSVYRVIDPFGVTEFTANDLRNFGPHTVSADGTYTLLVEGGRANDELQIDTYSINVHKVPAATETPLNLGEIVTDAFSTLGEEAIYTFSVTDFTQVHFDSLTNSSTYNWTLSNEFETIVDGRRFDRSDSWDTGPSIFELAPGDYQLTVAGIDETQDYSFRLLDVADATIIIPGTPTTSTHTNSKSTQVFELAVQAGDTFYFDAQGSTGFSTSGTWRLFDPHGNELLENSFTSDAGPRTLDFAGTYRILVEGRIRDTGANGEFTFDIVPLGNALNPTPPTPIFVGDVINGDIGVLYETDRYAFTLDDDSLIYFDSLTNDSSLNWTLRNDVGVLINERLFHVSDSFRNSNPVLKLQAGDYVLSVSSPQIEPYSFQLHNLAEATRIATDSPQLGEFTTPNETDIFSFVGTEGEQIYLDVVSDTPPSNATMRLVDQFGAVISTQTALNDQDVILLPRTGTFYLLLEAQVTNTVSNTYEINVVSASTTEATLEIGAVTNGSIDVVGDTVEYSFTLPSAATLYFDSLTNSSTINWTLEGLGGTNIARSFSGSDSVSNTTPLLHNLLAGDYKLRIDGAADNVGTFSFRLLDIDTNASVVTTGISFSDELTVPNQTNVYQFSGTNGDRILVDVLAASNAGSAVYRILDPLHNVVFSSSFLVDGENTPTAANRFLTLESTGTFTLLVEARIAHGTQDTYEINLSNSGTRNVAIVPGELVSDAILSPGEQVEFNLNIGSDTFVYMDSLTNDPILNWTLTGPTGDVVFAKRFDRTDTSSTSPVVFETRAGDYKLTVDGVLDHTTAFGFRLTDLNSIPTVASNTISGELNPGNVTDIYRFNANAGDNYTFDSVSADNTSATYRVATRYGQEVFRGRRIDLDQANVTFDVSGPHVLFIEGAGTATDSNAYQMDLIFNGNTPPATLAGDALTFGVQQDGDLDSAGKVDSYQFTITDRSLLHMDILTNNGNFVWSLRGPRGVEVSNLNFTATDSLGSATSNLDLVPGDYQLDVSARNSTLVPGPFAFILHDFAAAKTVTPGTPFSGELTNPAETDLYKFTANAGDRFLFDVVATNDIGSKEFKVIDQYGTVVGTSNALQDLDQIQIPRNGIYTLLVEGRVNNLGTDTYTMNIVPIASSDLTLTSGVSNTANLNVGGELRYEFSVAVPSLLLFTPQTDSAFTTWTLRSELGTFVSSQDFDEGVLPVDVPAGNYVLTIDGVNDHSGDADFTILVADAANVLEDRVLIDSQLTESSAATVYQFYGEAGQHFSLLPDFNMQFADAATSAITVGNFQTSGDPEDGWSGIDAALRANVFREGAAINFIVATDEERDNEDDNLSFDGLFGDLSNRDALLNMVINTNFRDENNDQVLGVDSKGNAYRADGAGGFTVTAGGFALNPFLSVKQDYIDLAFALDGAAWDIELLSAGGLIAESFTKAFVDVKVAEILEQTSLRLSASDPNANLTFTDPDTGVYDNIAGGQTYEFDIQIGNDGDPRSFDLLFNQAQTEGSIPVYIVAPYGYNAMAVDADGDTLTWSITEGPDGLVVDSATGILSWPADSVVYGQHSVTLRVEDGRGGFDEQTFELDVNGGEAASIGGLKFHDENEDAIYQTLVDVIVPGNSDPYLAGMPDGATASSGDVAPDQSPVFVEDLEIVPGSILRFAAAGRVSFVGTPNPDETPDGKLSGGGAHRAGAENGISNITANYNSLLGVFLSDAQPDNNAAPAGLDFRGTGENYTTLAPELQQLFFIGDGVTDDGTIQEITVPAGATRLFLGTMDGQGWFNNQGEFFVTISGPQEQTIPDWTIYLDQNRNGIRDGSELFTTTDANGEYLFDSLQPGSYVVSEELQPGWEQTAPGTGTFEITVAPGEAASGLNFGNKQIPIVNSDPLITSTPLLSVVARDRYRYQPTIEELDGDNLTFDLPLAPAGMAVNPHDGTITWTPRLEQVGLQNVLLRVKDERGGFDLQYFTITVAQPNTAPVISSTAPVGPAGINLPYQYNADAIDADGDTFAWLLTVAPDGATIDATTGVINWTPNSEQLGSQEFVVNVNDGRGLSDQQTFSVNVEVDPINADPEILSSPPVEAYLANQYLYRVQVVDVNGDPLTFTLDTAPVGMAVDADGLVSWTPTPAQVGSSVVRIMVEDGRGGSAVQEYSLLVDTQPVNQAPQITSIPKTTAVAGQAYNFQPTAVDANNDTLVWELVSGPIGMSINPSSGTLNWLPTIGDLGSEQVVIRVFDTSAAFSELGYTLNVRAVNTPPVIQSVPLTSASVGATFLHQVQATDVDGDQLNFALVAAPAGMVIDSLTGLIQWTPVGGQEGSNAVDVRVSDGNGGFADQSFVIQTAAGISNLNPTITSAPSFFAGVGDLYSYDVEATDPEAATLTYELLQSPTGMTIDGSTGLVQWTPTAGDLGTTIVRLVARDPAGAGSIQEYSLTVLAANNAPVISSTPPANVAVGGTYRYDVLATDADGEFLTYELVNAPAGMLMDGVGRIFWIATTADTGSNAVEVKVTDPRGGSVTQLFDITVEVDTVAPQVAVLLSRNPVNIGDNVDIRVSAIDNVGVESLSLTLDGVPVALDATGLARVPMNSLGSITAVATATDAAGNTETDTLTIFVSDPNDVEGPVLSITSPGDGGIVTGLTDIIGTVTDVTLVDYRLLLAEFGTNNFQQIATGNTNVTNDVLGQLDPTLLANGSYVLRLEAYDAGGRSNVTQQLVEITSENKLGNFRVGFTDLVVPVNGMDVVLARTYDSLNSAQDSDFGFGWRMDFRDVQLQVSVEDASDFDKSFGFYTPYTIGTRVYITLPGGERQGFTFSPSIRQLPAIFGPGLVIATPRFIPDAGVTSSLTVQSGQLLLNEFGETTVSGGLPWNPASPDYGGGFTLTTREGIAYKIDGNSGKVNRISDPNGNQLNFSDAGVTSNSGLSITFERDSNGRIVAVTDPDGNRIQYTYNALGDLSSMTDRTGNTTSYKYESAQAHFLTDIIDPLGNTGIRGEYDDNGRLISMKDADGNNVSITTNLGDNSQVIVDALGNQTIFQYDARGNTTAVTNALGNTTTSIYDTNNNLTSETDPLGNTTSYTYDSRGNVTSTTDPLGNQRTFSYGVNGVPLSQVDEIGAVTVNSLDSKGNVLSTTNPLGHVTSYTYDSRGNQLTETDALGYVTQFAYDTTGNLVTQIDATGYATSYTYDTRGNRLSESSNVTTSAGVVIATTAWTYDSSDRQTSRTDALGNTSRIEYNDLGFESAMIDENGNRTEFAYDVRGQLLSTLFADGTSALSTYDVNGRQLSSTDQLGRITHFEYDAVGNLTTTIYPDATPEDLSDNPRTKREYDSANRVVAQIDEFGNRQESVYDEAGRIIAVILPDNTSADPTDNLRTEYVYDSRYFLAATTSPGSGLTSYSYDLAGNLIETQFSDGTSTQEVFDSLGRRVTSIDQNGVATSYEYNELDRLTAVVQPLDVPIETVLRTVYGYDERGNFTTQTDANGNTTQYQYDLLSRRIGTTLPPGQQSTTVYDAVGNVVSETNFNGQEITFTYDTMNRLTSRDLPDGSSFDFTYTQTGQRDTIVDGRGTTTYVYDERDRVLSRSEPDGATISYGYDLAGNEISQTTPAGTVAKTYDELRRLTTVTDPQGGVTTYQFDDRGRLAETQYPNGTSDILTLDNLSRILRIETQGPSGLIRSMDYTLDATGRRMSITEESGRTVVYEYDSLYRLLAERITDATFGNRTIEYTYDSVGNRLTRTDSEDGTTTYLYDSNDRLLTETTAGVTTTYTYDANGNTLTKFVDTNNQTTYRWNAENRLISATIVADSVTTELSYKYDADGLRVEATVDGETLRSLLDKNSEYAQVVVEYLPSGEIQAAYTRGYELISATRNNEQAFYHADAIGTIRIMTGADGTVVNSYIYDAFGRMLEQSVTYENSFLYAGELRDSGLGLDFLRSRQYSPSAGRFASRDIFAGDPSSPVSLHKYIYTHNDPNNGTDPSGQVTLTEIQVVTAINTGLFASVGAIAGYKLAKDKGVNPYYGAVVGGAVGALTGLAASALGVGSALVSGGVISLGSAEVVMTALGAIKVVEVLIPLALVDTAAAAALAFSTWSLILTGDVGGFFGTVNELEKKFENTENDSIPFSSLKVDVIVETKKKP